jgi:DNA polymerase-3 subunit delta
MMSISPAQLPGRLKGALAPAYLLAGEEPLLLQEAADAVRIKARAEGFSEREVLHVDAHFDWDGLRRSGENLSLFASRRILEVRLGERSPGVDGARALKDWLEEPQPDMLLMVHAGRLEKAARESAWFAAFGKHGVAVYAWPVRVAELPQWIEARLHSAGLRAADEAVALLSQRTEGNLLACAQEIEKLRLLCPDGQLTADRVREAAADSANFDAFDLVEKALSGQQAATLQVVNRLREEGVDVVPIVAALVSGLRQLYLAGIAVAAGQPAERALTAARVWSFRQGPYKKALKRLPPANVLDLIKEASWVDRAAKGAAAAAPWRELVKLATRLSGVPLQARRPG